jgi:hypothetical protein
MVIEKFAVLARCYHVQSVCAPKNENLETWIWGDEFKQCAGAINAETIPVVHP